MTWVAGVDACRGGWCVVQKHLPSGRTDIHIASSFDEVLSLPNDPAILAVDMPIGLPDSAQPGGRRCEKIARRILGGHTGRGKSVFDSPVRAALAETTYPRARAVHCGSSAHGCYLPPFSFALFPKIKQVDRLMTPQLQLRVREVHPELCFWALNGGLPASPGKKTPLGQALRLRLLGSTGFQSLLTHTARGTLCSAPPGRADDLVGLDDVLDACASCWTAERIHAGRGRAVPRKVVTDVRGLAMQMWV